MNDWMEAPTEKSEIQILQPLPSISTPTAYEVVMRAGAHRESSMFINTSELLLLWKIWTPLLKEIESHQPLIYKVGSVSV